MKNIVDKVVKVYLSNSYGEGPKTPPIKDVVFRVMSEDEFNGVLSGKSSGEFWSSDPTEYGRHAIGKWGVEGTKVFVAAKLDFKSSKIYRGLVRTKEEAEVAHFNTRTSRRKKDIISAYKWDGKNLVSVEIP